MPLARYWTITRPSPLGFVARNCSAGPRVFRSTVVFSGPPTRMMCSIEFLFSATMPLAVCTNTRDAVSPGWTPATCGYRPGDVDGGAAGRFAGTATIVPWIVSFPERRPARLALDGRDRGTAQGGGG